MGVNTTVRLGTPMPRIPLPTVPRGGTFGRMLQALFSRRPAAPPQGARRANY